MKGSEQAKFLQHLCQRSARSLDGGFLLGGLVDHAAQRRLLWALSSVSCSFNRTRHHSQSVLKGEADDAPYRRLPAGEIEALVLDQVRALLRQPEVVVGTWRAVQAEASDLGEDTVRDALARFDPVWSELFPAEQERLIRLLVQRVVVGEARAQITLNLEGLASLARDLSQPEEIAA